MIEVAVAAQAAFKAYTILKAGVERGKEIGEMRSTVRKFFDAKEDIDEAVKKEKKREAKYGLEEGSTLGEAIDYIEEQEAVAKLEHKIKWFYIDQGKSATWAKIVAENNRRQRQRALKRKMQFNKKNADAELIKIVVLVFVFIGLGVGAIAAILLLIFNLSAE
tara:strand:- start:3 stop:491 length:489 start_codon:yes stop_codon:yes gene_type:complete